MGIFLGRSRSNWDIVFSFKNIFLFNFVCNSGKLGDKKKNRTGVGVVSYDRLPFGLWNAGVDKIIIKKKKRTL